MLIREVTDVIERFAPLAWQESYDNAGLIVGRPDDEVHRALLAVDVTDEVMAEAEREGCDMVITHHPIVFHALKRFNSADQVQRCVERAIRGGIALYACHTNLDSAPGGMSWRLAEMLGVGDLRVLQPAQADEKGRVRRGGRAARADGYGGVHAPHAARAGRSGRAPQRHRFARGAARGGLHRCGGFDDRRRAPCRG